MSDADNYAAAMYEIGEIVRVARDNPAGLREFLMLNYPDMWGLSKAEHRALLDKPEPRAEMGEAAITARKIRNLEQQIVDLNILYMRALERINATPQPASSVDSHGNQLFAYVPQPSVTSDTPILYPHQPQPASHGAGEVERVAWWKKQYRKLYEGGAEKLAEHGVIVDDVETHMKAMGYMESAALSALSRPKVKLHEVEARIYFALADAGSNVPRTHTRQAARALAKAGLINGGKNA